MPRSVAAAPSTFPRPFGRFVLQELLGEGGMGRVYRAVLTGPSGFRKPVAVKVLLPPDPDNEHADVYASSIRNEARLGALLRHPGLVEVFDHGLEGTIPWIAMELVEGVDLDALMRCEGPLPPAVLIDLGLQLCSALQYAHTAQDGDRPLNLVHRDLKPANVLVDRFGRIKITDLGIARSELATVATTAHGLLKGTPTFIAPEQILGHPVDGRADLFAVGAILFEAATGKRLFRRDGMSATVAAVLACDEVLLLGDEMELADAILPGLGDVLRGCLWFDPDVRFPTADVLAEALVELSAQPALLHGGPDLSDLARRTELRQQWSKVTVVTPDVAALPEATAEPLPVLISRTRIRAVGWPEPPTPRPPNRTRGLEGLLLAILVAIVGVSGPMEATPVAPVAPEPIPLVFTGPLLDDGGPAIVAPPAEVAPEPAEEFVPAPIAVTPPVALPVARPAPTPRTTTPPKARHERVIDRVRPGASRSFLVEAPTDGLAWVRLYLQDDGAWQHRPLTAVAAGYWGTVVRFEADAAGTMAYWFEVQPTEGASYRLGSPEDPWVIAIAE